MTNILQSEIFFFISSLGFIILGIFAVVTFIHILRAVRIFSSILEKAEKDIDSIGDTSKEMLEEIQNSIVFRFLFQGKKKQKKTK